MCGRLRRVDDDCCRLVSSFERLPTAYVIRNDIGKNDFFSRDDDENSKRRRENMRIKSRQVYAYKSVEIFTFPSIYADYRRREAIGKKE